MALIRKVAAVATHERTPEAERRAAIDKVETLCGLHGIGIEEFGFYHVVGDEEWEQALHFMDADYRPGEGKWPPSALAQIGDCAIASGPHAEEICEQRRHQYRRHLLEEARRRYRAGLFADPFTTEPKLREPKL